MQIKPWGRTIFAAAAFALSLFFPQGAGTIEIPLEGFGKATTVAFVNMHKVFEAFPETEKARVELNQLIDEKKADISAKKEEIAKLKGEIEFLKKQMQAVVPSTQSAALPVVGSTTAPEGATSLALPEGSPLNFLFSPPEGSTAAPAASTTTAALPPIDKTAPQVLPGIPSREPQLKEKEALLAQKQADLEAFIGVAESELKNLEEGKTMTLLARIYRSLEEIAAKEGYSIVVDKDNILYGEAAADITQNLIWRLSAPKPKDKEK